MKLIDQTTRNYLYATLFVFGVGIFMYYFLVQKVLFDGIDEALHQEKIQLLNNLRYETDERNLVQTDRLTIVRLDGVNHHASDEYKTIEQMDHEDNEMQDYRELHSISQHAGTYYEIKIQQSLSETETLLDSLLPIQIVFFLLVMSIILLISRYVSGRVWQPFYTLLEKIRNYDLNQNRYIDQNKSDIDEFNELGKSVERMTRKIYQDYIAQKEFNENTSHELQTPLAIIRNKLDLLIQSPELSEQDLGLIQDVYDAIHRLSHLNRGLLLLAKIDNRQFHEKSNVSLDQVIRKAVTAYREQIDMKNIKLILFVAEDIVIQAEPTLIETLVYNLLSNAVKYNLEGGQLKIEANGSELIISNTGTQDQISAEKLFKRFAGNGGESSTGLGLSIVKKICDLYGYSIEYKHDGFAHQISIELA